MRILLVGASGAIGRAVAAELAPRHELIRAGRTGGDVIVDATDMASVQRMYEQVGLVDAVITATGRVHFGALGETTPAQFMVGLQDKLMGQVNVVLAGINHVRDGGSFTLTSGYASAEPVRGGVNASTANGAVDGFVIAAATDLPRGLRINAVSPTLLTESAEAYGDFFPGFETVPAARVALAYRRSVEGVNTGRVITVWQ